MLVFAGMGGAGERKFLCGQAKGIRRAALDQRNGLHRLAGGPGKHGGLDIACLKQHLARAIHHHGHAAMTAFDQRTTGYFNGHGILHGPASKMMLC